MSVAYLLMLVAYLLHKMVAFAYISIITVVFRQHKKASNEKEKKMKNTYSVTDKWIG